MSSIICVPNEKEDVNLNVFNMIAGINESKILAKHVSIVNVNLMVENVEMQ